MMSGKHIGKILVVAVALLAGLGARAARADELLGNEQFSLKVNGVVRNFVTADFNGDKLRDVIVTHIVLDEEKRTSERYFSLFLQTDKGFGEAPNQTWAAPKEAVGIDVANFDLSDKGPELGYVASGGIYYFKFDKNKFIESPTRLFTASTIFRTPDPHGVVVVTIAEDFDHDGQDEIIVYDFEQTYIYRAVKDDKGAEWRLSGIYPTPLRARVSSYWENDILLSRIEQNSTRMEFMLPEIMQADFDGDGQLDIFLPREDRVYIYQRDKDGKIKDTPTLIDFGVFPLYQGMRHGSIPAITRLYPADFNGDGLADIVISRLTVVNLADQELQSDFFVFINKGGKYGERPDETMKFEGFIEKPLIADFNGDGRDDIAVQQFEFGFAQLVRLVLFQSVRITYKTFYSTEAGLHAKDPSEERDLPFDFDLSQQSANLLTAFSLYADFDGDRRLDLIQASNPGSYEILLSTDKEWAAKSVELQTHSSFFTFPEDLNGDGRDDLLIRYANQGPLDSIVRVVLMKNARENSGTRD